MWEIKISPPIIVFFIKINVYNAWWKSSYLIFQEDENTVKNMYPKRVSESATNLSNIFFRSWTRLTENGCANYAPLVPAGLLLFGSCELTPWFPMHQIGAFQPLRRDRAKLRDRRMSWIVSKGRAAFFLSHIEALSNYTNTQNSKKFVPWFSQISQFFDFESGLHETARSYNLGNIVKTSSRRSFILYWSWNNTRSKIL